MNHLPITEVQRRLAAPTHELCVLLRGIPSKVFRHWQANARREFAYIPQSANFFLRSACVLFVYFKCVEIAGKQPTLLPSKAADSVWHAWLECDPESLSKFCARHFGTDIRHEPVAGYSVTNQEKNKETERHRFTSIQRTYVIACVLDNQDFISGYVPSLFRHDTMVKMPYGHNYVRSSVYQEHGIYHSLLDWRGNPDLSRKPTLHVEFSLPFLIEHGYLKGKALPANYGPVFAQPRESKDYDEFDISVMQAGYHRGFAGKHYYYDYDNNRVGAMSAGLLLGYGAYVMWSSQACGYDVRYAGPEPPPYVPYVPTWFSPQPESSTTLPDTTASSSDYIPSNTVACGGAACGGGGGGGCGGCG